MTKECQPAARIRAVADVEFNRILEIINAAAQVYKGAIEEDCWHEPYMPADELRSELIGGVSFRGIDADGQLVAVMGVQQVRNVHLIRHAYVLPEYQGTGLGGDLLAEFISSLDGPILIGTWRAATWAIAFYEKHGFRLISRLAIALLLRTYWHIPERQMETSVVLGRPPLDLRAAESLAAAAQRVGS